MRDIGARAGRVLTYMAFSASAAVVLALGLLDTAGLMAATGLSDLVLHAAAFLVLGALGRVLWPAWLLFVALVTVASGIELAQYFGPWHEAGLLDVVAGAVGAASGILLVGTLQWYVGSKTPEATE